MIGSVIALGLLGAVFQSQGDIQIDRFTTSDWRVEVKQDRFTGKKHCTATNHDMVYDRGVLTFHFSPNIDTANAVFRIDDGAVRTAGSVAVEAAGLGANFSSKNTRNSSNGEVHIPVVYLSSATTVAIKPNDKAAHRDFKLRGLSEVLTTMQSRGCGVS